MASSLPTEKLDRTNYASWSYKMHQYLLGHNYWSMSKELMTRHPNRHTETSRRGSNGRAGYYIASHHVWANSC